MIRKKILSGPVVPVPQGLDLESVAHFEVSSEDPAHPLENALRPDASVWSALEEGEQLIRLKFDVAQDLHRIHLRFDETKTERTQEFLLSWLPEHETRWREIRRQQFNFSPQGSTTEREDIEVEVKGARAVELRMIPKMGGGGRASLTYLSLEGSFNH